MRHLSAILLMLLAAMSPASEPPSQPYPLWAGHESIEHYAKRTNLPPIKTLDLGNGVNLDLVLIPAGKFIMRTPEPVEPQEDVFTGQMSVVLAGAAAFALVVIIVSGRWPQPPLSWRRATPAWRCWN